MAQDILHLPVRIAPAREAQLWLSAFQASATRSATLMLVGIRDLKQINDLHGRKAGNAVIAEVGRKLAEAAACLKGLVLVSRLPGREFLIILGNEGAPLPSDATARRLLNAISGDVGTTAQEIRISPRIGIATAQVGETGEVLLRYATAALGQAYARKGKKYVIATMARGDDVQLSAALDRALRRAIEDRQIAIMLQPQFAVADGRLVGAEALARWQHPELGEIGAAQLFATADRCDLCEELSNYIQEQAIALAAAWPLALADLRLSVNLGAEELNEDYSDRLMRLLQASGFPADRLTLELTEESLIRDIDLAAAQLETLRQHSVRIALDDFGTGYSSLAYLKTLPLDYLKLDKGMTPDIGGQGKERIVLRAIIAMGKALGLQIIAEGVERTAELEMLRAEGCDYYQGFLSSPALTPHAFVDFALRSN
jgi:diguanylate cyclase (GGDEF)-like protein